MAKKTGREDVQELTQTIECKLPGFEGVTITYDLLATQHQVDNFVRQMGGNQTHIGVVANVEGWPKDEYGADPWDTKRVPGVFQAWASKKGWAMAMKAYLEDPNF